MCDNYKSIQSQETALFFMAPMSFLLINQRLYLSLGRGERRDKASWRMFSRKFLRANQHTRRLSSQNIADIAVGYLNRLSKKQNGLQ